MEQFYQMLNIQMTILIYLFIGWLCYRQGIITENNRGQFIRMILNLLMPAMVFHSFRAVTWEMLSVGVQALIASTVIYSLLGLLGGWIFRNYPHDQRILLHYAVAVNNAGLGGQPLAALMYGDYGAILAAIYLVPHRIFMWSAGIAILSNQYYSKQNVLSKLMKNPSIIAVVLGIARGLLQVQLPEFVDRALGSLSAMVSPFAMMIIGSVLATVNLSKVLDKAVIHYTVVRLFLIPFTVLFVCRSLSLDPTLIGVMTIMSAMPAGSTTALLAGQFHLDEVLASKITFVTTILSIFTVPMMMLFI